MLIAHLADTHLGYRAYHRITSRGANARELDVAEAFREAIQKVIAARPDLVLVAGDVFHTVRPSNSSIADAFRQFASLRALLPDVPVVIIAGNHDSPRSADTGNILSLFREIPDVHVVTEEAERVQLHGGETSIFCLPHNALARSEDFAMEPEPSASLNILTLHATVTGEASERKIPYVTEFGGVSLPDAAIRSERWDYVALGHYHVATDLAPNMWYAGSTERTSTNIWTETGPKGFLLYDTEREAATFHALERPRPVVDVDWISGRGLAASEIDAFIEKAVARIPGGLEGKIVRVVVTDIPRHVTREIDHRRIREYKAEALHFQVDARPPEIRRIVGAGAPMRRQSLRDQVESYLTKQWIPTSAAIDRDRLVSLARGYMDAVGEGEG